ncbi:MAG TPA: class I SAM-dependent methyltransferase [Candidatus Baltobacteraceae bacterium]|jgi:SAM-dependent methyltransferase|nr:class I SAM-dependent methyltransferase [Candidatus Baltobacteraceae bacterium]
MVRLWEELCEIICCPEDREGLDFRGSEYFCRSCSGRYPIVSGRIVDLRPRSPQSIPGGTNPEFARDYLDVFHGPLEQSGEALAWGATEVVPPRWARLREREVRHVLRILEEKGSALHTFCDFSAGAGYYTLSYARAFPLVLHCDLSADSLFYASQRSEKLGMNNIVFLRIDYLRPPFDGQLDCAICMDSLERGEGHERMLLGAIHKSLRPGGVGVVDFHNWWHNPLRRLGLLPQNFGNNRSYSHREAEALLSSSGITNFRYHPFHQEFEENGVTSRIARVLLPSTRHLFFFTQTGS